MSEQNELELNSTGIIALTGNALGEEYGHQDYGTVKLSGVRLVNEKWLVNLIAKRDELLAMAFDLTDLVNALDALPGWFDESTCADAETNAKMAKVRAAITKAKGPQWRPHEWTTAAPGHAPADTGIIEDLAALAATRPQMSPELARRILDKRQERKGGAQ